MSETDDTDIDGTSPETRLKPFILVTGTPGVGKTATSALLAVSNISTGFEKRES
jgi:Cdc6-like AAA superfamily ATPase